MQVGELAPAHLVHPHPLPRRSHEHHLLRHMAERPDPLPRPLETLGGPGRQILERRFGLGTRSEEHTSELQSQSNLVCRLLLEKKKKTRAHPHSTYMAAPSQTSL